MAMRASKGSDFSGDGVEGSMVRSVVELPSRSPAEPREEAVVD